MHELGVVFVNQGLYAVAPRRFLDGILALLHLDLGAADVDELGLAAGRRVGRGDGEKVLALSPPLGDLGEPSWIRHDRPDLGCGGRWGSWRAVGQKPGG